MRDEMISQVQKDDIEQRSSDSPFPILIASRAQPILPIQLVPVCQPR